MVTPLRPPQRPLAEPAEEYIWTWQPGGHFMVRVFHAHPGRSPLRARTFGPLNRFDPHVRDRRGQPREQGDGRGVNYLAETLSTALAEAFPEQSPAVAICPLQNAILAGPVRPSRLLDLTGDGVMQIGAVATLASGNEPRRLTQRWGRGIYEDMPALAGIRYRGAHQGGIAVAVWERAGHLIGEMIGDPVSDGGLPLLGGALREHRRPGSAGSLSGEARSAGLPALPRRAQRGQVQAKLRLTRPRTVSTRPGRERTPARGTFPAPCDV